MKKATTFKTEDLYRAPSEIEARILDLYKDMHTNFFNKPGLEEVLVSCYVLGLSNVLLNIKDEYKKAAFSRIVEELELRMKNNLKPKAKTKKKVKP